MHIVSVWKGDIETHVVEGSQENLEMALAVIEAEDIIKVVERHQKSRNQM